jgi:hypothetical protein
VRQLPEPRTVDEILAQLRVGPPTIAELTRGARAEELYAPPEPDAWSVNDVLAHLRACGDVLGGNLLRILAEDRPSYRRVSPRAHLPKADYLQWRFEPALEAYSEQRAELLAVLESKPREAWSRFAYVTEAQGKVRERTVQFYGEWLAGHEAVHLPHIGGILETVRGS